MPKINQQIPEVQSMRIFRWQTIQLYCVYCRVSNLTHTYFNQTPLTHGARISSDSVLFYQSIRIKNVKYFSL